MELIAYVTENNSYPITTNYTDTEISLLLSCIDI